MHFRVLFLLYRAGYKSEKCTNKSIKLLQGMRNANQHIACTAAAHIPWQQLL